MINPSDINLSALPSVPLEDRSQLPQTPCIYFAIDSLGTVQYIGRSVNPAQRWVQHHRHDQLNEIGGVKIAYLFIDSPDLLPSIEEALIDWFAPLLNATPILRTVNAEMSVKILLKQVRELRDLSINELARATGLSPQYLGKLERSEGNPSLQVIEKLCKALESQPGDLLIYCPDDANDRAFHHPVSTARSRSLETVYSKR